MKPGTSSILRAAPAKRPKTRAPILHLPKIPLNDNDVKYSTEGETLTDGDALAHSNEAAIPAKAKRVVKVPPEVERLLRTEYESLGSIKKKVRNGIIAGNIDGKNARAPKKILGLEKNKTISQAQLKILKTKELKRTLGKGSETEFDNISDEDEIDLDSVDIRIMLKKSDIKSIEVLGE